MVDVPLPDSPEPRNGAPASLMQLQPLLTLIIAVVAIGLAVWEGAESRRHNRLTVKPKIAGAINAGRETGGEYVRLSIESTGLGPAVINTFRVYFDGEVQGTASTSGASVWDRVLTAFDSADTQINAHGMGAGYYFPAGGEELLFEARRSQSATTSASLVDRVSRLAVQICYCSVYNTDCDEVVLSTRAVNTQPCNRPQRR